MIDLSAIPDDLQQFSETASVLPRSGQFMDAKWDYMAELSEWRDSNELEGLLAALESDDDEQVSSEARFAASIGPDFALVVGLLLRDRGLDDDAAGCLEAAVLAGPFSSTYDGAIVLGAREHTMINADLDPVGAIIALAQLYASRDQVEDALNLLIVVAPAVDSDALLLLRGWLLAGDDRWQDVVDDVGLMTPLEGTGRIAVELLVAEAHAALGQFGEANALYTAVARLPLDQTPLEAWGDEASSRLRELGSEVPPAAGGGWYDPLSIAPLVAPSGPSVFPSGPPPERSLFGFSVSALSLGSSTAGKVILFHSPDLDPGAAPGTWLALLDIESHDLVLDNLLAEIASPVPLVGFINKQPDPDLIGARRWQRIIAGFIAASTERPEAVEFLTEALTSPESRVWVENVRDWAHLMVTVQIDELSLSSSGDADSLILAVAARLHASGRTDAALQWLEWGQESGHSPALAVARIALLYRSGQDDLVIEATDRFPRDDDHVVTALTFRARSLQRRGALDPAIQVLDEAVRLDAKDRDSVHREDVLYLRARAAQAAGDRRRAKSDLSAILASDSTFIDAAERLAELDRPAAPGRLHIPTEVKRAVFERDGGNCTSCGASFDIQYDHVIPVALGGSSNLENLQLLCGTCNRRKSASLQ